jgi:hypothetical protein
MSGRSPWTPRCRAPGGASGTGPWVLPPAALHRVGGADEVRQLHEAGELRRLFDGGVGSSSVAPAVESDLCPTSPARDPARSSWRTKDAPLASATATRMAWFFFDKGDGPSLCINRCIRPSLLKNYLFTSLTNHGSQRVEMCISHLKIQLFISAQSINK